MRDTVLESLLSKALKRVNVSLSVKYKSETSLFQGVRLISPSDWRFLGPTWPHKADRFYSSTGSYSFLFIKLKCFLSKLGQQWLCRGWPEHGQHHLDGAVQGEDGGRGPHGDGGEEGQPGVEKIIVLDIFILIFPGERLTESLHSWCFHFSTSYS